MPHYEYDDVVTHSKNLHRINTSHHDVLETAIYMQVDVRFAYHTPGHTIHDNIVTNVNDNNGEDWSIISNVLLDNIW